MLVNVLRFDCRRCRAGVAIRIGIPADLIRRCRSKSIPVPEDAKRSGSISSRGTPESAAYVRAIWSVVTRPGIFATVRTDQTLLRGPDAERAAKLTAAENDRRVRRTCASGGWIVPTEQLDDVRAWCQSHRVVIVTKDLREKR